jgi:hypothetical protein
VGDCPCAPDEPLSAQGQDRFSENQLQDPAGEAIGLAASLAAGLASGLAAALVSGEAAGLASVDASGAGVSSDLVQAVAAKNIEKRASIRNFRITTSLILRDGAGQALSGQEWR